MKEIIFECGDFVNSCMDALADREDDITNGMSEEAVNAYLFGIEVFGNVMTEMLKCEENCFCINVPNITTPKKYTIPEFLLEIAR